MSKGKKISMWIGSMIVLIISWGLIEPYYIDVGEEEVVIENLPSSWENKKIAVMGDFQLGMWMDNTKTVEWMVEDIIEMQPELVLLTGDYIYHAANESQTEISKITELLKPLTDNQIPVFGVLGNHDYALASETAVPNEELANTLEKELELIGINILQNESVMLSDSGTEGEENSLHLAGIGSRWADNDNASEAFANLSDSSPRIVLMHNPDTFKEIGNNQAPVGLAGHTHGGQLRIPYTENWSYLALMQEGDVHADGWINDYGKEGNHLYVNRGVGFSIVPLRLFCPPELTILTLRSSE